MTQGDRLNYQWKPNDYSTQTLTRYSMEMDHWLDAFRGSVKSGSASTTSSLGEILGFAGLFISLFINLCTLVILLLIDLINWVRNLLNKPKYQTPEQKYAHLPKREEWLTDEELDTLWANVDENTDSINIRDLNENS